jgi:DNA repair exonuclease SbcCD ATPase subunit
MKKVVTLKELRLINFKGIKSLTAKFGAVTEISGANATGKTTINDAFTWVLFGKDAQGNSDTKFGIKTVGPDGQAIEKIDHEVTAILDVNGETIELRRVYAEDWVKPRGSAETVLKGHTTSYFYNGVPLKEGEYRAKISAIVEEAVFKMITNPLHFAGLDWQTQREMLLRIAGGVTFEEIAANRAEFSALLAQLSGKDLAEFKAEISVRKRKIQDELDKIPARIDEITRATPEAPDYEALEAEKNRLTSALEDVDRAMSDRAEASRQHYEKAQETQRKINGLRSQQQEVVHKAKEAAREEYYKKNAAATEASNKLAAARRDYDDYTTSTQKQFKELQGKISTAEAAIEDLGKQVDTKRNEWHTRNAEVYQADGEGLVCPVYKTLCSDASVLKLDTEAKGRAKKAFDDRKEADLAAITKAGGELNTKIEGHKADAEAAQKELDELTETSIEKSQEYETEIARLKGIVDSTPAVEDQPEINAEDLAEYVELAAQITELSTSVADQPAADNSELTAKKQSLTGELDEVKRKLSLRSVIEANNARKVELEKSERDLAQQKADLEKQEFTVEELTKERMAEVERRVNQKFKLVRFRMFDRQINGGEKPDCIPTVDGVKFGDLNNACKINAGLDIINTLCDFHAVSAPIFVDNAEAVNELLPVAAQLVKLIVTTSKELQIS